MAEPAALGCAVAPPSFLSGFLSELSSGFRSDGLVSDGLTSFGSGLPSGLASGLYAFFFSVLLSLRAFLPAGRRSAGQRKCDEECGADVNRMMQSHGLAGP